MNRPLHIERELDRVREICSATTVTIGGLYLTSHSVAVTALGAVAATTLASWSMWLAHHSEHALTDGPPSAAHASTE
jgi:hypothetical protein